jgi:hypothetical protein
MNAETKPRIGFIGLGLMGHGMAKNLVTRVRADGARHKNRKPLEDLLAAGAKEVATNATSRALPTSCSLRHGNAAGRGDRVWRQWAARGGT